MKCCLCVFDVICEKIFDIGFCLEDWCFVVYIVFFSLDFNILKKWVKYVVWDVGIVEWNGKVVMIQKIQELDVAVFVKLIFCLFFFLFI